MKALPAPNIKLYSNVAAFRKLRGCTQTALAFNVGISRRSVIRIEKGEIIPSVLTALRLSYVLDTPVNELFTFKEIKILTKDEKFDLEMIEFINRTNPGIY